GREALSYDLAADRASEPRAVGEILRGLPDAWADGIDTAVNWGNGKAYIFKGHEYVRYDIAGDRVDGGAPRPIASNWPGLMRLIDWAPWHSAKMPERGLNVGKDANGQDVFLCAAIVGHAIYPGRTWATSRTCNYSDGQLELRANIYAIATTALPLTWNAKT